MILKPYHQIKIIECGEPLVPIPPELFVLPAPPPYQKLGAPYHLSLVNSPYYLRQGVLASLIKAHVQLQLLELGWRIFVFDAYRPIAVQQFMVDYTFSEVARSLGFVDIDPHNLSDKNRKIILDRVYQFWAPPSLDPATPPPHSTGAAVDISLVNAQGEMVEMGSPIDEVSARSFPNYFAERSDPESRQYHHHRQILAQIMRSAGFQQHPNEWWHFCLGDQMWAWLNNQHDHQLALTARYGRYDKL